jgi:hypothetical protein
MRNEEFLRGKCSVEFLMIANPNPGDGIALKDAHGSVVSGNTNGPVSWVIEQAVEMESRMLWIGTESLISSLGRSSDPGRKSAIKLPEARQGARFHRSLSRSGLALP